MFSSREDLLAPLSVKRAPAEGYANNPTGDWTARYHRVRTNVIQAAYERGTGKPSFRPLSGRLSLNFGLSGCLTRDLVLRIGGPARGVASERLRSAKL